MNKAKPRASVLLALWVLGSFAIVTLPGFAYAQIAVVDDSSPGTPDASGDPDMPGEKPPAQGGPVSWNTTSGELYAGSLSDLRGRPETLVPARAGARVSWRLWLESLAWALRMRLGW